MTKKKKARLVAKKYQRQKKSRRKSASTPIETPAFVENCTQAECFFEKLEALALSLPSRHSPSVITKGEWIHSKIAQRTLISKVLWLHNFENESNSPKLPPTLISQSICVSHEGLESVFILGKAFPLEKCSSLDSALNLDFITCDNFQLLIHYFENLRLCPGNPDLRFVTLLQKRKGKIQNAKGVLTGYLESNCPVVVDGQLRSQTVRSASCHLLILPQHNLCCSCVRQRASLRAILSREDRQITSKPSKFRPNVSLSTPMKAKKLLSLARQRKRDKQRIESLEQVIEESVTEKGEIVDPVMDKDLREIMSENQEEIERTLPKGSYRRLFWEQQRKAANAKSPSGMRWHPWMIRWALCLKMKSSAAYHVLATFGFIKMPSERRLRDYTHFFEERSGFQREVLELLADEAKFSEAEEIDKLVGIAFDKMKIREDLVYHKGNEEIIGFVDLGNLNNKFRAAAKLKAKKETKVEDVATHVLVLMVRGIATSLRFPYAHFSSTCTTYDELLMILWEGIELLERTGFIVLGVTCDGAGPNRKFFRAHGASSGAATPLNKTPNPYANEERFVYFFSDVPHLIKTTRNCWSHSFQFGKTRSMTLNEKVISWKHLQDLYRKSCETSDPAGFKLVSKLKIEHVEMTSFSRMRVDLAAQVLSQSVASALEHYEIEGSSETARFCRMFDRAFDALNARSINDPKPWRRGFRSSDDERLRWLEDTFLGYLNEWEQWISTIPNISSADSQRLCLSRETLEGWRISVTSFVEIVRYIFSLPSSKGRYILSEHFSQDPLENYFGKQRGRGGRNENPSVNQCLQNAAFLRLQGSLSQVPVSGNLSRKRRLCAEEIIDDKPLRVRSSKISKRI